MKNTAKKVMAGLVLTGSALGVGASFSGANAATTNKPHYDWYKVSVNSDQSGSCLNTFFNVTEQTHLNYHSDVMYTADYQIKQDSHKVNQISCTVYYRALSSYMGGKSYDNGKAYAAWKSSPNTAKVSYEGKLLGSYVKGKYTPASSSVNSPANIMH